MRLQSEACQKLECPVTCKTSSIFQRGKQPNTDASLFFFLMGNVENLCSATAAVS